MEENNEMYLNTAQKFGYSLLSGVLFLLLANPVIYQIIRSVFNKLSGNVRLGDYIANEHGCASLFGLIVNSSVFTCFIFLLMIFSENKPTSSQSLEDKNNMVA